MARPSTSGGYPYQRLPVEEDEATTDEPEDDAATARCAWLIEVKNKLSTVEFCLLKAFYLDILPLRKLESVQEPRELFEETKRKDSFDLLVYGLGILVPHTTDEDPSLAVGARSCLEGLRQRGIVLPPPNGERLRLSQKSKMMECLVGCCVNMTEDERSALKRELLHLLEVHEDNATIFYAFSLLFSRQQRCPGVVETFVASLNAARSPRTAYVQLRKNLRRYGIPHARFAIPGALCQAVKRLCRRKTVRCCICLSIPVSIGLLILIVGMPVFSAYLNGVFRLTLDDSGFRQMSCPHMQPHSKSLKAATLIGKLNSFWFDHVTITQNGTVPYSYMNVDFYLVPSKQLKIHNMQYSCSNSDHNIDFTLYLLKGSRLNFSTCVQSENGVYPGVLNLTVCTTDICYQAPYAEKYLKQVQLYVEPNKTNCTQNSLTFTAPNDQFYYITSASITHIANATLKSYEVDVSLLYFNASVFHDPVCTSFGSPPNDCQIWLQRDYFFQATEYSIIAVSGTTKIGQLQVEALHRRLAYAVPGTAAAAVIVLGFIFVCLCFGVCHCLCRRRENVAI